MENKINMREWLSSADPVALMRQYRTEGLLAKELPEVEALSGVPQAEQWHPEIDTYIHTEMVLAVATRISNDPRARYAALVHDLGKGVTPQNQWPSHHNHEELGVPLTEAVALRFGLPDDWRWLGSATSRYHLLAHTVFELKATTIVKKLRDGGFLARGKALFNAFVDACEADKRGRLGKTESTYPQAALLRALFDAVSAVEGEEPELHMNRVSAVKAVFRSKNWKAAGDSEVI